MAAVGQQISVTTSPTLLFEVIDALTYAGLSSPAANIFKAGDVNAPLPILITFPASSTVYLGGSAVTTSGASTAGLSTVSINVVGNDSLYACTSTGTVIVSVLAMRQ